MHVLIADDEPGTRLLVRAAVERLGHRCSVAEDGAQAWQLVLADPPEVLITDWQMPGLDGTALTHRIRDAESAYTYILVLTGEADETAARQAIEAGADDLVHKPLDASELERKLIAAERVTALHRQLHGDARQDALTGAGNLKRLSEDLAALHGRVTRYRHAYCVALFGLDRWGDVDERAGDDELRGAAEALRVTIRTGDALYRYDREQFLVLLPEQRLETAVRAAERLREAVQTAAIPQSGGGVVTVSAGVAGFRGEPGQPDELLAAAVAALEQSQASGRNRVEVRAVEEEDPNRPLLVLVADDDAATRLTLKAVIARESRLELVGEAEDAAAAIELAERARPDLVLLDLDMPGGGGVRAADEIRARVPGARIVAISGDDSPDAMLAMSRAGAVGYLVKGAPPDEIVRALESAARW
jgi:diguanylate cyclase (GGDEF)-like protein